MGINKKYYWLKLKDNFFTQKEIKKLRRIAGGDTYTIIYLKLQLLSLKNEGKLFFEGLEDTFIEEMSLELDEDVENVKFTIMFLQKYGLLDEVSETEYLLPETIECIGSETQSTIRSRKCREKQKTLQCNTTATLPQRQATNCNTEIETERRDREKRKEIEVDIEKESPAADIPNELNNLPCDRDLPPLENSTPKSFEFYEENFVKPNGKVQAPQAIANDLIQAINTMGDDLVLLALQKTLEKDATWRYAKTILDSWKKTGIKTIQQAINEKKPIVKKGEKGNGSNKRDSNRKLEQQLEDDGMLIRV